MPDLLTFFHAFLLGIIEGLTEFLPVSSTGHLILFVDILGFKAPPGKAFEIIIQLGAILAVIVAFWPKIWRLTKNLPHSKESQHFAGAILLAFLPAMAIGALAHDFIRNALFNPHVVSVMLIVGGFVMLIVERICRKPVIIAMENMPYLTALKIGLLQCLAMVPGVSRSGATIMGAMVFGVERKAAAEFSFFLAIPTMLAATVFSLYSNWSLLAKDDFALIAVGFVAAFLAGFAVAKSFIRIVGRFGFAPFAFYRILMGSAMLAFFATA